MSCLFVCLVVIVFFVYTVICGYYGLRRVMSGLFVVALIN